MAERLRRRNSGDDRCQADVSQSVSQGSCSLSSIEKPTVMVTNCPGIAFALNKRYPKQLERNEHCQSEHKSVEDLREDISCGIQL